MILTICDKCGKIIMEGGNSGDKHHSTIGYDNFHLCDECEKNIIESMRKRDEMREKVSEALSDIRKEKTE